MESLKEELGVLKEEYRNLFLLLLADLTGSFTSFYQVLIQKVDIYVLIVSMFGFIGAIFIVMLIYKIKLKMNDILNKMKGLK